MQGRGGTGTQPADRRRSPSGEPLARLGDRQQVAKRQESAARCRHLYTARPNSPRAPDGLRAAPAAGAVGLPAGGRGPRPPEGRGPRPPEGRGPRPPEGRGPRPPGEPPVGSRGGAEPRKHCHTPSVPSNTWTPSSSAHRTGSPLRTCRPTPPPSPTPNVASSNRPNRTFTQKHLRHPPPTVMGSNVKLSYVTYLFDVFTLPRV